MLLHYCEIYLDTIQKLSLVAFYNVNFCISVLKYWTSLGGVTLVVFFCFVLFCYILVNTQTFICLHIRLQILIYFDGQEKTVRTSGFHLQEVEISCSAISLDFSIHKQNKGAKVGWLGFFFFKSGKVVLQHLSQMFNFAP